MSEADARLKLYIKPGCPWCVDATAFLKKEGYQFEEYDVIRDGDKFQEMRDISGQTLAPTMTYGELVLPDFDVSELVAFLEKHEIVP